MKKGWTYKKLGEVCNIDFGTRVVRSRDAGSIYPVYGGGGATFKMDIYNREDSMVISRFGMSEQCTRFVKGKFFLNDSGLTISMKDNRMIQSFMNWQILSLNNIIYSLGRGAAQKNLDTKALAEVQISYPDDLIEQQSIVDYLDAAFAKIDALKANAEKALGEAKALFQASLKEMLEPKEGWEEKKLGEIAEIKGGKRLPKGEKLLTEPTTHKYIRVADFNEYGTVDLDDIRYISDNVYEQIKRYIINKEDIYISIAGTIGKSGIIPEELDGANLTENACRLILSKEINQRFMYYSTISPEFIRQEIESTKISAQPKLALTRLAEILIAYPSITEQQSIVAALDSLKSKVDSLQENYEKISKECDALKQAMLREIFE